MNYTPKQLNILNLVKKYTLEHGYAPTLAELAIELKVSTVTVFEHLEALERKGALTRRRHEARSIELKDPKTYYKHFKGDLYEFVCEAKNNDQLFVVYRANNGQYYVRPKDEFFSKVIVNNIEVDRFKLVTRE
jgi:hypothetical protein